MPIPFVDLKMQYVSIQEDIEIKIASVLNKTDFILGEEVAAFEREFSSYIGTAHAIGVASGTDALQLSLHALGVGEGDEVITVPNTFVSTVDAILRLGAKPVFVDINEYYLMDCDFLEKAISNKTKVIIPVHLYGQSVDIDSLMRVIRGRDIRIVEDACQAHGALYRDKHVGIFGDAAAFSFYPGKNLGAYGDGGIVVTNSEEIARKVRMLRNYGQQIKYHHEIVGYNSRLDEIQAGILRVKLAHLDNWNNCRRRIAQWYNENLRKVGDLVLPCESPICTSTYHLYVIRTKFRDRLKEFLGRKAVASGIHYPIPIHLQPAYAFLGYGKRSFPKTEEYAKTILSLPIYPELSKEDTEYICAEVQNFYSSLA